MAFGEETTGEEVATKFADEIKGRTSTVTGVTLGGIGVTTVRTLASRGAKLVIILGRKQQYLEDTIADIKMIHLMLMSSLW